MPDIDSLSRAYSPPRSNNNSHDNHHTPSPRASITSLAAAATVNHASQQHDPARRSSAASIHPTTRSPQLGQNERRRSSAFLANYDPALPGPGELQPSEPRLQTTDERPTSLFAPRTSSPHAYGSPTFPTYPYRDRTPSLGEIHQELEQEQEFRVVCPFRSAIDENRSVLIRLLVQNRLLSQIRDSQAQLQAMRESVVSHSENDNSATDQTTPPIERVIDTYPNVDHTLHFTPGNQMPNPVSPGLRGSRELSRQSSRRSQVPSRTGSPSLRSRPESASIHFQGDGFFYMGPNGSGIDSTDYYRAETQNLTRENQMLRQRIRELGMSSWLDDRSETLTHEKSASSVSATIPPQPMAPLPALVYPVLP